MKTIIAIVGASGAGKTHASLYMQDKRGYYALPSYTTRLRREGEVNGREHIFTRRRYMPSPEKMCAYTYFGKNHYWATWQQIYESLFPVVYVIDEKGLVELKNKQAPLPIDIISVKIKRSNLETIGKKRKERDNDRISFPESDYDYIIENDGTLEEFEEKLESLCNILDEKIYGNSNN